MDVGELGICCCKNSILAFLSFSFLVFGVSNTILYKTIMEYFSKGVDIRPPDVFFHPFLMSMIMFLSMSLMLIPYYMGNFAKRCFFLVTCRDAEKYPKKEILRIDPSKPPMNELVLILPSLVDVLGVFLLNFGLFHTHAFQYQMLFSFSPLIFTTLLSLIYLKQRFFFHQYLGLLSIFCGLILSNLNGLLTVDERIVPERHPVIGSFSVFVAMALFSVQFVVEEWLLNRYQMSTTKLVGLEGLYSSCINMVLIFICYHLPGFPYLDSYSRVSDFPNAFGQAVHAPASLIVLGLSALATITLYNYIGLTITRKVGVRVRCVIDVLRVSLVWLIQILLDFDEFDWLDLTGFVIVVLGSLIYHRVFTLFCYDDFFVKLRREKVEKEEWANYQRLDVSCIRHKKKGNKMSHHFDSSQTNKPLYYDDDGGYEVIKYKFHRKNKKKRSKKNRGSKRKRKNAKIEREEVVVEVLLQEEREREQEVTFSASKNIITQVVADDYLPRTESEEFFAAEEGSFNLFRGEEIDYDEIVNDGEDEFEEDDVNDNDEEEESHIMMGHENINITTFDSPEKGYGEVKTIKIN